MGARQGGGGYDMNLTVRLDGPCIEISEGLQSQQFTLKLVADQRRLPDVTSEYRVGPRVTS